MIASAGGHTWRSSPAEFARTASVTVAVLLVILIGLALITEPVDFMADPLSDGYQYSLVVDGLRTGAETQPKAHFAHRLFPPAIVALSGLDLRIGYLIVDVLAILGTALLMLVLLRPWVSAHAAVAAVVVWALMPFSMRTWLHYPVLPDALAVFFLVALFVASQRRDAVLFAGLFAAAILTRENLIILAPLLLLRSLGDGPAALTRALIAPLPGLAALVAIHLWPPVTPVGASVSTPFYVAALAGAIWTNEHEEAWRVLAGPLFALGALVGPLLSPPALRIIRSEAGWLYVLVTTMVVAAVGGGDHDRYVAEIAPIATVAVARSLPPQARTPLLYVLAALQLVAARVVMPLRAGTVTGVYNVPPAELAAWSAVIGACCLIAVALVAAARRRGISAEPALAS